MSPEYGATIGFFPVDEQTLDYLRLTGRAEQQVRLIEAYCKEQGLFRTAGLAGAGFHRHAGARSRHGRAEPGRAAPSAGSRAAERRPRAISAATGQGIVEHITTAVDPKPWSAMDRRGRHARPRRRIRRSRPPNSATGRIASKCRRGRRAFELAPRRGGDRRDHELHQHLESVGDAGRGTAGEEGGRARTQHQAVGQDQPRAGIESRHRLSQARRPDAVSRTAAASTWSATAAPPVSATAARCPKRSRRRSSRAIWSHARC